MSELKRYHLERDIPTNDFYLCSDVDPKIAKLKELLPQWVPVSERLPDEHGHYLILSIYEVTYFEDDVNKRRLDTYQGASWFNGEWTVENVTHYLDNVPPTPTTEVMK